MTATNNLDDNVHEITVPPQHALIELIDANETYLLGSRGSFKSSVGGGLYNIRRVFEMPRSTGVGVGITFNNLYENTLPPFKAFLLANGFVEDVHFTMNKPPPPEWPKPYMGIVDKRCANAMCWYNGTIKQFISLRRKASANGVSAQWGDFDEVKFMNQKELNDEIFPIFRGNEKYFSHCSGYLSKFFMTDKNAELVQMQWILKKRELVNQKKVDIVLSLAIQERNLKEEYNTATKTRQRELRVEIHAIETRLAILRSNMVYVAEINVDDVRPILGEKWYKDKERNSSAWDWNHAYKNLDPDRPGETFYPSWNFDKHTYDIENDIDRSRPLILTADYQHTIAPITISQIATLPGRAKSSLNYIDEFYTLHPKGLRDAVYLFCDKYKYHGIKVVYYVFDHTARGGRVDASELWEIVVHALKFKGWTVIEVYTGQAPGHYQKYLDTTDWLENKEGKHIDIMINRRRCPKLIKSITSAAAITTNKETKKDKRPETNKELDQSETTHFSDEFDMTNDAVLKRKLISNSIESRGFVFK